MPTKPCILGIVLLNLHRQIYHFPNKIHICIWFSEMQLRARLTPRITPGADSGFCNPNSRLNWAQKCNTAGQSQNKCRRDSRIPGQRVAELSEGRIPYMHKRLFVGIIRCTIRNCNHLSLKSAVHTYNFLITLGQSTEEDRLSSVCHFPKAFSGTVTGVFTKQGRISPLGAFLDGSDIVNNFRHLL